MCKAWVQDALLAVCAYSKFSHFVPETVLKAHGITKGKLERLGYDLDEDTEEKWATMMSKLLVMKTEAKLLTVLQSEELSGKDTKTKLKGHLEKLKPRGSKTTPDRNP